MKLSAPKVYTFWISIILALLGLIGQLGIVSALGGAIAFWLLFVGFVLLTLGAFVKGF